MCLVRFVLKKTYFYKDWKNQNKMSWFDLPIISSLSTSSAAPVEFVSLSGGLGFASLASLSACTPFTCCIPIFPKTHFIHQIASVPTKIENRSTNFSKIYQNGLIAKSIFILSIIKKIVTKIPGAVLSIGTSESPFSIGIEFPWISSNTPILDGGGSYKQMWNF